MANTARRGRQKISTTIAPGSLEYLEALINSGQARNLAEAIDLAIEKLLVFENRERLADDTATYYTNMTEAEAAEERGLESALWQTSDGISREQ
jgi:hypothetical protein